jgi:chorismate mutase
VENLTVREMLLYTAEMKLEMSVSMADKIERVEQLLQQLALKACQNVCIGGALSRGISGVCKVIAQNPSAEMPHQCYLGAHAHPISLSSKARWQSLAPQGSQM